MKKEIKRLPAFSNIKGILQVTTTVSLGDFNYFHGSDKKSVAKAVSAPLARHFSSLIENTAKKQGE